MDAAVVLLDGAVAEVEQPGLGSASGGASILVAKPPGCQIASSWPLMNPRKLQETPLSALCAGPQARRRTPTSSCHRHLWSRGSCHLRSSARE